MNEESTPTPGLAPSEPLGDWKRYDPKYRAIADFFGVEVNRDWSRFEDKINYFHDWAKDTVKTDDTNLMLQALRKAEKSLGNPSWNEKRIDYLYRVVRLDQDRVRQTHKRAVDKKLNPEQQAQILAKTISQAVRSELKIALKDIKPKEEPKPQVEAPQEPQGEINGSQTWW